MNRAPSLPHRFLTAEWRYLLMLNYEVEPAVVQPFVPAGTALDFFNGRTYLSVVGFRFERARVLGMALPWHQNFEEVKLRLCVRRIVDGAERRGVVFIKEIVPRRFIAWTARTFYNESYVALPMRSVVVPPDATSERVGSIGYQWYHAR